MPTVFDDHSNFTDAFKSYLSSYQDADNLTPLTGVMIVEDTIRVTDILIRFLELDPSWFGLINTSGDPSQGGTSYPIMAAHLDSVCGYAYLVMSRDFGSSPLSPEIKKVLTLGLVASDAVIVGVTLEEKPESSEHVSGFQSLANVIDVVATLKTELRPSRLIILALDLRSQLASNVPQSSSDFDLTIERLFRKTHIKMTWSFHIIEYQTARFSRKIRNILTSVSKSTPHFTETTWIAYFQTSWTRLNEGKMPESAISIFTDRLRNRGKELLKQVLGASSADLYQYALMDEIRDIFEREAEAVPAWVQLSSVYQLFSRQVDEAVWDAAQNCLQQRWAAKLDKALIFINTLPFEKMRSRVETLQKDCVSEYRAALKELTLVEYERGRRLMGLGLKPDEMELAQLGSCASDQSSAKYKMKLTSAEIDQASAKFSEVVSQAVEAALRNKFDLLCQQIRQKLDTSVQAFETLCVSSDVSSLAHNVWSLCVAETRLLWRRYGRGLTSLQFSSDQLRKCSEGLADLLVQGQASSSCEEDETDSPTEIRHPWDILLMQVMSHLISQLDLSVGGVTTLLEIRGKAMRAQGLSQGQAKREVEALKEALFDLDLINTRPRSLGAELLPLLRLKFEEQEELTRVSESVRAALKEVTFKSEGQVTTETHTDTVSTSPSTSHPDFQWHWSS